MGRRRANVRNAAQTNGSIRNTNQISGRSAGAGAAKRVSLKHGANMTSWRDASSAGNGGHDAAVVVRSCMGQVPGQGMAPGAEAVAVGATSVG